MALYRTACRMGLRRLHNDRARYLISMHKVELANALLPRSGGKGSFRDALRALSLSTDALIALQSGARY
jgi:hypothetical protein